MSRLYTLEAFSYSGERKNYFPKLRLGSDFLFEIFYEIGLGPTDMHRFNDLNGDGCMGVGKNGESLMPKYPESTKMLWAYIDENVYNEETIPVVIREFETILCQISNKDVAHKIREIGLILDYAMDNNLPFRVTPF